MSKSTVIKVCPVKDYLSLEEVKLNDNNPRAISRERLDDLKKSIVKKGFYEPILIWKKGNVVLAGNHRVKAAKELITEGYCFVNQNKEKNVLPVVIEDIPQEIANQILYETNNHYADWIEERLQLAMMEAKERGDEMEQFGFTNQQLDDMIQESIEDVEKNLDGMRPARERRADKKNKIPEEIEDAEEEAGEYQEALILPVSLHGRLVGIFQELAQELDSKWTTEQSIVPAVKAFCDYVDKNGMPDMMEDEEEEEEDEN